MENIAKTKVKRTRVETLIVVTIWLMFLTQKLAISIGSFSFPLALFIFPIFFISLYNKGRIKINFTRAFFYLFFMIFITLSTLLSIAHFSLPSFLLLLFIYLFFIFDYEFKINERTLIYKTSRKIIFIFAVVGILQFVVQFIGLPFIDPFVKLPDSLRLLGFNNTYSITNGSEIMKSNGIIYLEPSFFSQFVAIGIVFELFDKKLTKANYIRMAIYLLALVASFSGTGIVILALIVLPYFFVKKVKNKFLFVFLFIVAFIILINTNYGAAILARVGELTGESTSGAMRFVNPIIETFSKDNEYLLFGNGAGSTSTNTFRLDVNFNAALKVCYEYGLFALVLYVILVGKYFFKNRCSLLSVSLFIMYLILSGNLLSPTVVFLFLILLESESKKEKIVVVEEKITQTTAECA